MINSLIQQAEFSSSVEVSGVDCEESIPQEEPGIVEIPSTDAL